MWHVETDFFSLAIFLIMLIKERQHRKEQNDIQSKMFYIVLIFSIISNMIDIGSSIAMNSSQNWWVYEISMTAYVISMPMLAAIWVCYAYVLIHSNYPIKRLRNDIIFIMVPYIIYTAVVITNPVTNLFFNLTRDMQYSRSVLFMPAGVGSIMLYSVIGLLLVLFNHKKIEPHSNVMLLTAFFVTTSCFIWIQLANPGWLVINASYAIVYVWCDITVEEQRRNELYEQIKLKNEELKVTAERAESAAHAKSEFLSRMSHDIRTPMNAIIGLTHLAEDEENMDTVKEYLNKIDASSDFLLGLINDILDMSKIENGDLTLKEDVYSKEEFVNSINTVIRPLADAKHINFIFSMDDDAKYLFVDKLRFNQIFFNLLSNAVKFTPDGGTVEFTSINLQPKDDKLGLRFFVRDTGIGMSEEFLPHIYDPFSQERSKTGDNEKGTGLGLPIVKSLVDSMGGTISVKSELGKGTEFVLDLYIKPAEPVLTEDTNVAPKANLNGAKILLVEDNDLNIYVAQVVLEKVGCVITVAKNGQEAIDRFSESEPGFFDAILMDVRMPIMGGIEATKRIRALDRADAKTVKIIAMTADAFEEERKKTIESGMNYHLSKPIDPELLYEVLSSYIKSN